MKKTRRAFALIDTEIDDIASLNGGLMAIYWFKRVAESELKKLEIDSFKTRTLKVIKIYVNKPL